jgi:hypothetical protein
MAGNNPSVVSIRVLLAEGVEDPHVRGIDRLDTTVSEKHHAQVCPLRVLRVR